MFAVFKLEAALPNQLQEQLIYHARRLQHVLRALPTKESTGDLPQLRIDQLEKMFGRSRFPLAPLAEKHRDFARLRQENRSFLGRLSSLHAPLRLSQIPLHESLVTFRTPPLDDVGYAGSAHSWPIRKRNPRTPSKKRPSAWTSEP